MSAETSGVAAEGPRNPLLAFQMTPGLWHGTPDDDQLMRLLTEAGCPIVCVGYVNDTGWHTECEQRAREAFRVLRGWVNPTEQRP